MQNSYSSTKEFKTKNKPVNKNNNHDGKGKEMNTGNKKENSSNNKENIPSNNKTSKHNNTSKKKNNNDDHNDKTGKSNQNPKGKSNNDDHNNKKGNNNSLSSRKKSKQNLSLNKKSSFSSNNYNKKSNRKNSTNETLILKMPQPTEVFDKSVDSVCVSKLPSYVNGQMVDNGIDKYVNLIKQSLTDHEKVKLIGVEPALALTISIILILEEQKAIRKPVILTKTMEDKNKNLKSGIITELYPNTITNKVKSKVSK